MARVYDRNPHATRLRSDMLRCIWNLSPARLARNVHYARNDLEASVASAWLRNGTATVPFLSVTLR